MKKLIMMLTSRRRIRRRVETMILELNSRSNIG